MKHEFWAYAGIFILFAVTLFKFLFTAIQEGQMLGKWQDVLDKIYSVNRGLSMLLGACGMCFAHLISIVCFVLFVLFVPTWILNWYQSVIFYPIFVTIAWFFAIKTIPKQPKDSNNGM